jgi:hypothetical protein
MRRSPRTRTPASTGLRAALGILAVMAIIALFLAGRIPTVQPGQESPQRERAGPGEEEADTFM